MSKGSKWHRDSRDLPGFIGKIIGTGKNAFYSIIFIVITMSFLSAIILSIILLDKSKEDIIGNAIKLWGIFIAIIGTFGGYLMGKTHSNNN